MIKLLLGIWFVWICANVTRFIFGTFSLGSLFVSTLFCFVLSLPSMISIYLHEVHKMSRKEEK